MAIEFKLPEVSEGVASVEIAQLLVAAGDVIEAGAVICEVETDKAVAEITCPYGGRITELKAKPGDSVAVGQTLLLIEPAAADQKPARPADAVRPAAQPSAAAPSAAAAEQRPEPARAAAPQSGAPAGSAHGSPVEFRLPEVSEGVNSVDIASWNVRVGDVIAPGTTVCEVETDKAVAEITCPFGGTVTAVHVTAGAKVEVGALLMTIQPAVAATGGGGTDSQSDSVAQSGITAGSGPTSASRAPAPTAAAPRSGGAPTAAGAHVPDGRAPAPAGPATRRLARKLGVDLYQVRGTATGGRITIDDVEAYVRTRLSQETVPAPPTGPGYGVVAAAPLPDFSKFGPVEKQPLNKIFRTAAANLQAAWVTIPHVTQHDLADVTELEAARQRYVKTNAGAPKITMTAIMIKAVVGALRAFPTVNSSIDVQSGELIVKHYYHIGVAVDTPQGLVVPVIRNCDQKNVLQVAAELAELAAKARDRKLKLEDMQGGTFTITNLGGIGGTAFTPIVNYPEVAILGIARGQHHLVLEDGQLSQRLLLPLSLSYDHRAINGAEAARFIVKLSSSLSNFFELF